MRDNGRLMRTQPMPMNVDFRKPLPGTNPDWFDVRAAIEAIRPGAYATLSYTCLLYTSRCV